jgi:hypothetical protein
MRGALFYFAKALECARVLASLLLRELCKRFAQDDKRLRLARARYLELVLRVVVEIRSSPVSFGSPMASTLLPV